MKNIIRSLTVFSGLIITVLFLSSCGYTTASLLPPELSTIYVDNFANKIDPTKAVSDRRSSYSYRPGLENLITRAVIDRIIVDGNLDIDDPGKAALRLEGELIDLRQYPLSYAGNDDIEEFRMEITVNIILHNNRSGKIMWKEKSFMGNTSYTVTGANQITDTQALQNATDDLAARIVERIIEAW